MQFADVWHDLRSELDAEVGSRLVAPLTGETISIESVRYGGVAVRNPASGEEGSVAREEFERVYRTLCEADGELALARLAPATQRCVAAATLHPRLSVDDERGLFRLTDPPSATRLESEVHPETAGVDDATRASALRFDAALLGDLLEPLGRGTLEDVGPDRLVDLYTVLRDVRREAAELERSVGRRLFKEIPGGGRRRGRRGTVTRTTRRRAELPEDETVREALAERDIDPEEVSSLDPEKVAAAFEDADASDAGLLRVAERDVLKTVELGER